MISVFSRFASRNVAKAPETRSARRKTPFIGPVLEGSRFFHFHDVIGPEQPERRPLERIEPARQIQGKGLESVRRKKSVRAERGVCFAESDSSELAIE